jgi:hypothetical protein
MAYIFPSVRQPTNSMTPSMITKIKPVFSYTVTHGVGSLNSASSIGYDRKKLLHGG